jgi:hypothetical protein
MLLVPETRASIKVLKAGRKLHYLFQETQYSVVPVPGRPMEASSLGESDNKNKLSRYQLSSVRS